jgi:hypothetical protein
MEPKRSVWVSIRSLDPSGFSEHRELGEFHEVWKAGISIGSDPGCSSSCRRQRWRRSRPVSSRPRITNSCSDFRLGPSYRCRR